MQLVLNTFGVYLSKVGDCFEVKTSENKKIVSAKKVHSILITTGASLSTDAIELAMIHNIDVVFLNKYGQPYGRLWQSRLGSTSRIRRRQFEISDSEDGLDLVIEWIATKIKNQIDFIEELIRHRKNKAEKTAEYLVTLYESKNKLAGIKGVLGNKRNTLMGIEGGAGRAYFAALSYLIPSQFKFNGRSRQPAKDEFNATLNYCYGILYSLVERGCLLAGLDPFVGFLHTDNYNKKSLVFDLIEPFRIIAEKTTFYLFSKRMIKKECFNYVKNGVFVNTNGKKILIASFNERMETRIRYRGKNIQQCDVIQAECHRLANRLLRRSK